jgi:hypothetical protein
MNELALAANQPAIDPALRHPLSKTYLLAADAEGRAVVSVHVKRCYRLRPGGALVRAEGEIPLLTSLDADPDPRFNETDIVPCKQRTDVIVMAKAWGHGRSSMEAGIRVGKADVRLRVVGDRRVIYRGRGSFVFSEPEPFESMEMRYENAYGGFDTAVSDPPVRHLIDLLDMHPGEYPRNPIGKGYAVLEDAARLDGLPLPNIEHPAQCLTPERLVTGSPEGWWRQPLPWSCNWFPKHCYPRVVHYRGLPPGLPDDDSEVEEVRSGWLERGHVQRTREATLADDLDSRFADAASPALVLPLLHEPVPISLSGLMADGDAAIQIPDRAPRISVRHRSQQTDVIPAIHRILISTLEMGVYVVWHANWYPDVPLPGRLPRMGETMATLLDGVDVEVDGERVAPLGAVPR